MRPAPPPWTVVLPLKGGPAAKSRLRGPAGLATAVALDTLAAALAARRAGDVLVVTGDPALAATAGALGARVVDESVPGAGLPAAVRDGVRAAAPDAPCAVLLGDLPALTPADLDAALDAVAGLLRAGAGAVVVPDADGTGSVLLAAGRPAGLSPAFGPGSAARHEAAGAVRLEADLPRLRRDVDTPDDLAAALALGVGPRTRAAARPVACGEALR